MSHNRLPDHHAFPPDIDLTNAIETPYAIGQLDRTLDVVIGEGSRRERRIYWEASPDDELLKPYAGWAELVRADENGNEYLGVPTNASRASTHLGGKEAWSGEKDEILAVITRYIIRVAKDLKGVDVGLSLDTVGVERGNYHMFAAPPHHLANDPMVVRDWADGLYADAEQILNMEPRKDELLGTFRGAITALSDEGLL